MTLRITREELATVCGGTAIPSTEKFSAAGVEYDSRAIRGGELFVALAGEKEHGHVFLQAAFDRGAALFLVEDEKLLNSVDFPERLVVVKDSLEAFQKLAAWWRKLRALPTVAITGSVGKTTVKEMAAAILLTDSPGIYSLKSHNNHVGVPYTISRIGAEHRWTVLEMGMNHAGELTRLSQIGSPEVAVITCIAPAHIGFFDSIDKITAAKFEIVTGVHPSGIVILNGDDPRLRAWVAAHPLTQRVFWYGSDQGCDLRLSDYKANGLDGISFHLTAGDEAVAVKMTVVGKHNAHNAAAAVLAARAVMPNLSLSQCALGLAQFRAPLMRLNVNRLPDGRSIIDDSYNANPESMAAAVQVAGELVVPGVQVGLVLGDMLELGAESKRYHLELGAKIVQARPGFVISVGAESEVVGPLVRAAGIKWSHAPDAKAALALARAERFDILLVKASRGVGLEFVVQGLSVAATK